MVQLFIPTDGRITSQNILLGPLDGTEVMEIVSPGNATSGNTYQVTTATLGASILAFLFNPTVIVTGATVVSPYLVQNTNNRILFDKIVPSPSYAMLPLASDFLYPIGILFKDIRGDAATNNITITFSGGELCDGLSEVVIENNFGWVTINSLPGGGSLPGGSNWYLS